MKATQRQNFRAREARVTSPWSRSIEGPGQFFREIRSPRLGRQGLRLALHALGQAAWAFKSGFAAIT